jgi:hypothetical protein
MRDVNEFKRALKSKSPTGLTKALSQKAGELGYRLRSPYTVVTDFRAKQQSGGYSVSFNAKLYLHYSALDNRTEGLLFIVQFGGKALSNTPNPPADELFYAGVVKSVRVYGYGSRWVGPEATVSQEIMDNLELPSKSIMNIGPDRFVKQVQNE